MFFLQEIKEASPGDLEDPVSKEGRGQGWEWFILWEEHPWDCLALILESGNWISLMNPDSNMWMLIAALFVISKNSKQPRCPLARKGPLVRVVQRYNRRIPINGKKWTDTYNSMGEFQMRLPSQKAIICRIPFIQHSAKSKTSKVENRSVAASVCGWGKQLTTKGHGRMLGGDGTVLYLDCSGIIYY